MNLTHLSLVLKGHFFQSILKVNSVDIHCPPVLSEGQGIIIFYKQKA